MRARVYLSVSDLARRLDVPRHRVLWVVTYYAVPYKVQVGECRGYDESAVEVIREHLARIDSEKAAAF